MSEADKPHLSSQSLPPPEEKLLFSTTKTLNDVAQYCFVTIILAAGNFHVLFLN